MIKQGIRKTKNQRIMKQKWKRLRKQGIKPPKTSEENATRAKAAHGY